MRLLSEAEKSTAASQVRDLVVSSGQEATLLRKQVCENLYGSDEGTFTELCTFPLELSETPPADIAQRADAVASVLPELVVRVEDRVRFQGCDYRVQTITPQSLFGVLTHKVLELVKLHGG